MGFFFFFYCNLGWFDIAILVSNCGGWFAVEALLQKWILVAGGCAVNVLAVVDDNGEEIIYYFNVYNWMIEHLINGIL